MTLGWTGPLGQELKAEHDTAEARYIVPSEGTIFWLDTWVMLADAPHPNAAYALLNFIHEPEIQAEETNYNRYATPNDEAKKFIDPKILDDRRSSRPTSVIATSRVPRTPRATSSASTSGRSSSRRSAADAPTRH